MYSSKLAEESTIGAANVHVADNSATESTTERILDVGREEVLKANWRSTRLKL
jgi:hypothetical protein